MGIAPIAKFNFTIACAISLSLASIGTGRAETAEQRAEKNFLVAKDRCATNGVDSELAWQFARASFDWAEFAKTDKQRAAIAEQGIAASRRAVEMSPESAGSYYYLGMNLGQLARTKSVGALKLVDEMEVLFKKARELDEQLDFAGPDRNLGLLYFEAPIFSVGDKKKARIHLQRAVTLRGDYPENHLNLIEAYLHWGEKTAAEKQMATLNGIWAKAKQTFTGEQFLNAWPDWERRREKARAKLQGKRS